MYYRSIFDRNGADWTIICHSDYKDIPDSDKRKKQFYRDGISTISEFISEFGYLCHIQIPKRYKRHFDAMLDDE